MTPLGIVALVSGAALGGASFAFATLS